MAKGYRSDYQRRQKTWQDIGSGRVRHRIKTRIENYQRSQQEQPQTVPGWDLPRVSMTGAPGAEQPQTGATGLTYQEALPNAFTYAGSIHKPQAYWEDPQNVIKWYDKAQADPTTQLPTGMDKASLDALYNYVKWNSAKQGIANRNLWRAVCGAD